MSRSTNARKGSHRGRKHQKRHSHCGDGSKCSHCAGNYSHAATKQALVGS